MPLTSKIIPCVGAVVFRGDDVLLIKRAREPLQGKWSIPGGKLDYGEGLEAAILREVREETGVEISVGPLIGVFEDLPGAPPNNDDSHRLLIDYLAFWLAGAPRAGDDAAAAEFVPIEEAFERLSWDKTRQALRSADKLRRQIEK